MKGPSLNEGQVCIEPTSENKLQERRELRNLRGDTNRALIMPATLNSMHIFLVDICPHIYVFCVVSGIRYNHFLSFLKKSSRINLQCCVNCCCCSVVSHVRLFLTPWTAACQASLSFTLSWSCTNSCPLNW